MKLESGANWLLPEGQYSSSLCPTPPAPIYTMWPEVTAPSSHQLLQLAKSIKPSISPDSGRQFRSDSSLKLADRFSPNPPVCCYVNCWNKLGRWYTELPRNNWNTWLEGSGGGGMPLPQSIHTLQINCIVYIALPDNLFWRLMVLNSVACKMHTLCMRVWPRLQLPRKSVTREIQWGLWVQVWECESVRVWDGTEMCKTWSVCWQPAVE